METALADKIIVITGASGGIGSAIARKFAAEGAHLVLHCRSNVAGARELQRELPAVRSIIVRADLTKEADVARLFRDAKKQFGRVDTLVANAGSWETRDVPLHAMSLRQWRHTQDAVLTSAFLCAREFLKLVANQQRGNLTFIASTAGVFGEAWHADYAAAKAAMAFGLTRTLKNEIARLAPVARDYCGGRVNCVCPGWTVVPRTAGKLKDAAVVRRVAATRALPQMGRPDDIANAVVYLSSDALARHVTGETMVIAGGMEGRLLWQPQEVDPRLV